MGEETKKLTEKMAKLMKQMEDSRTEQHSCELKFLWPYSFLEGG